MKISACVISFNEEKNIARCLHSLEWADEILVVDSGSIDATREISESCGAKVLNRQWQGFASQKQFAVDAASNNWIFSLDADEEVSEELKKEMLNLKNLPETNLAGGFQIPRLSIYMNRRIRHGGWYPDFQLRFFNRRKGFWKDVLIHESVQMSDNARIGKLKSDILHYSVPCASYHHKMIGERYAPLAAKQMFESGRRTTALKIATVGTITFLQKYVLKRGFLDGLAGFCIARFAAHHSFLKHLLLWEMQNKMDSNN